MRSTRLLILMLGFVCGSFSGAALAESTLHVEVEAARVEANAHSVALLVKVTDTNSDKDSSGKITTALPAPGSCIASFKDDDVLGIVAPCYAVHISENGNPVETVKVRILDTIGDSNWAVLTWNSNSEFPVAQRSIQAFIGVSNGWYTDNPERIFSLGSFPSFNPARPYAWLYRRADQALNDSYQQLLSSFTGKHAGRYTKNLRDDERVWVSKKEHYCRQAGDAERCRWLVTVDRIDALGRSGDLINTESKREIQDGAADLFRVAS